MSSRREFKVSPPLPVIELGPERSVVATPAAANIDPAARRILVRRSQDSGEDDHRGLPASAGPISRGIGIRRLRIFSKRGTAVTDYVCSACGSRRKIAYFYRDTNFGGVILCAGCRDQALAHRGIGNDAWPKRFRT